MAYHMKVTNKNEGSIDSIFWPVMSPDMKPIELAWDGIGRNLNRRNPACQNLDGVRAAIVIEWHRFPQANLRRRFSV